MSIHSQGVDIATSAGTHGHELRRLMDARGLHVVYQPILDVRQGRHFACEALIRGPENSMLHTPAALFAAAASERWTHELEWLAVETAILSFAEQHCALRLFVNMSISCLHANRKRLVAVQRDLLRLGMPPSLIVIELTETESITDFSDLQETLQHFRGIGIQIAIDNMGKGFSNLRMWSEVRPEFVKIDRHFVSGIDTDLFKRHFVLAMNSIADACGCPLIVEGVETAAQSAILIDIGIAYLQGFGIARPHRVIPPVSHIAHLTVAKSEFPVMPSHPPYQRRRPRIDRLQHRASFVSPDIGNDTASRIVQQQPTSANAPENSMGPMDAELEFVAANCDLVTFKACHDACCQCHGTRMMPQIGAKQAPAATMSLAMSVATVSSY